MNSTRSRTLAALAILLFGACTSIAHAHHSGVAFDTSKTVQVSGTVTRFVWRNPHMAINMEVVNDEGETELWKIEGPGTTAVSNMGLNKQLINIGDQLTVVAHPLKSGNVGGLMQTLTLADGSSFGVSQEYQAVPARQRVIPALLEWEPPPEGETWQEREEKTRPDKLPLVGRNARQTGPGALDPDNLARTRPSAPFDVTGTWEFRGEDDYRPMYGWYEFKPHPEFTEKGKATYAEFLTYVQAGKRYLEPTAECYPAGMPRLMTRYGPLMMLQHPTAIFILSRLNNEYRVIWLDGREREPEEHRDANWNGESIGHWEGETLVVETMGFTDEHHLIQQGVFTGDQLKITERITMLNDGNTVKLEFIMTDPEHWVGEWRHIKFRDRILRADVREATCIIADKDLLPGM
jgi:hypothetical protein